VLAAACDGGFKVSSTQYLHGTRLMRLKEAATNSINMDLFDPETVKRMVQFMYTQEYDDGGDDMSAGVETLPEGKESFVSSTTIYLF
jgi:hypothetical protein